MDEAGDKRIKHALLGGCSKRSKYGHWIRDGRCIECGLTKEQLEAKFGPRRHRPVQRGQGVWSLTLGAHIAECLGVFDQAKGFIGRGSQAREYARVVREKLGITVAS